MIQTRKNILPYIAKVRLQNKLTIYIYLDQIKETLKDGNKKLLQYEWEVLNQEMEKEKWNQPVSASISMPNTAMNIDGSDKDSKIRNKSKKQKRHLSPNQKFDDFSIDLNVKRIELDLSRSKMDNNFHNKQYLKTIDSNITVFEAYNYKSNKGTAKLRFKIIFTEN